jgi:DNA ligase (NAD+)
VTISRATGHHAGNVIGNGIDRGAVVKVCRSGQVIPYIESVVTPATLEVSPPQECKSCGEQAELIGNDLMCTNTETCPAQIEGRIEFFFKTLGNCDGFGPKVIEKLCSYGVSKVSHVYDMQLQRFIECGFGEKTGHNLFMELSASIERPIEDWRFLAAFSIHNIGKGGCERLLKHHRLLDIFDLTYQDFMKIDGFGDTTAKTLVESLARIKPEFDYLHDFGFNLIETPRGTISSPVAGKTIVFTGAMAQASRSDMEAKAKSLGAFVSSSVSSKTAYLVIGEKVGANKTDAAKKHGTKILTEIEYLSLLSGED